MRAGGYQKVRNATVLTDLLAKCHKNQYFTATNVQKLSNFDSFWTNAKSRMDLYLYFCAA
jgi:hypothetical protein